MKTDSADLKKYIDAKKSENIKILDSETKRSKNDLINFIKKENIVLCGKSAIEAHLGNDLTLPIYTVFKNSLDFYKDFFTKLNRKYKYAFNPITLSHKNTIIFDFRLVRYLIIYKANLVKYELNNKSNNKSNNNNFIYTQPLISLMDIYYIYSTPIYNWVIYEKISKIEQKYFKIHETKYNKTNSIISEKNSSFHKKQNKIIIDKYIKKNDHILITGIIALNDILGTNYCDTIDIIISPSRLNNEIDKLKKIVKDIVIIKKDNTLNYFLETHDVFIKDVKILTFYITDVPFSYYKKHSRSNYHTILFMLIYKMIINDNNKYIEYINMLLNKSKKMNVLKNNKFQCFQTTYVKDAVLDFLLIKNKITDRLTLEV